MTISPLRRARNKVVNGFALGVSDKERKNFKEYKKLGGKATYRQLKKYGTKYAK